MKKRLISMLLAVLMVIGLVPTFVLPAAAAADVVKVEHNGETTYYASLQKAFDGFAPSNNTYGGKYVVTLLADNEGNLNKVLSYPTEVLDITLDLNGHTIKGDGTTIAVVFNLGSNQAKGSTITIKDSSGNDSGKITGGKGGVKLDGKDCTLKFEGGTITGNHGSAKGGGIFMGATSKLVMTGGVITGNSVTGTSVNNGFGGGVLANNADILGGKIYANEAIGKTTVAASGRGGGVATEVTRTKGYSTLNIANGVVYGNTATNAGDDVMAQCNGMSATKFTLAIGTENWYVDGWNGKKAAAGGGEQPRYDAENPVAYTDGGFVDQYNKSIGLKYVAPVAALPEAPDSNNDFSGREPFMFDCQDDIYAGVFFYYFVSEYATASEVYEEDGEYFVDITWNVKAFWESVKSWWDGSNGCGEHSLVDETVGYVVFTAKWNAESDKWEYEGDYIRYYITCASSVAPTAPDSYDDFANSPFTYRCELKDENGNYPTVAANNFEKDYCASGDVYENNGEYFCDITWNMKKLWEEVDKPWFDSYVTYIHVGDHQPVEEFLEDKVFTAKWNGEKWEYVDEDAVYYVTCVTAPVAPEAPDKYGENVTPDLIRVICDTDTDHEPMLIKWQHQSTKVRTWVSGVVWSAEENAWVVPIRIDSIKVYYVWEHFNEEYNEINHDLVSEDQKCIDTYLKWDEDKALWVTLDEKPIDVHVTCTTAPTAPSKLGSFQIQVMGDLDFDGIYGENGLTNDSGRYELFTTTIPAGGYTLSEVYGSRNEGFFVDVTVTLEDGDLYITNWIENRAPDQKYVYNWNRTEKTVTITLKYTGNLDGDLYGNRTGDWVNAATGTNFGSVSKAYVMPEQPASPKQENVTDKLVAIICDSDADRHATAYGKWYPQHCRTTSEITWDEATSQWKVDVRIGSLYIMYVDQLEDANGGTTHKLVDDITTVYATLVWDVENELWVPEEDIELHTTCRTAPLAPTYNKQLKSYQVKVWGELNGEEKSYTLYIPEDGYTIGEVYGSREEGFYVDITINFEDGDIYQTTWIENKNPGYFYTYDYDKTPEEFTFTLRYNGSLTGTLYGDRHAVNTNYDWVLDTNGKTYGVVVEAYLKQVMETARIVIYRNGNTTTPYTTVSLGKIAKGEVINLSDYAISDYYTSAYNFEFYGWYNDGAWNQYKAGKNPAPTETITVSGWTNIICMIYDSEEIVVKSVIDGDTANATVLYTGTAIYGTSLVEWLEANVSVSDITGYSYDKWYDLASGAKIADDATVDGPIEVYVAYTRNAYTITFNTNGGSDVAPITQTYGYAVSAPANPTKTGYTFTGWVRADGSAFSFNGYTMEAADFTLTATWQANKYDVLLIPNYGKINSGNITEYTYAIGAKLPTNITRPGYIFVGWYDNASFKGEAVTEITATDIGEKVFYAKWEIDMDKIPTIRAYDVYVSHSVKGGSVSVDKTFVPSGVTVTITVEPELGYVFSGLAVTTVRGQNVKVRKVNETTYKFTMPASDVVVDAAFEYVVVDTTCKGDKNCPMYSFKDLDTDMWYHDGIHYCLENGLMNGYGNNIFAPEAETTRAMIVTILWRLEGSPKADYKMTFKDVKAGEWYTEAIRWAASEGIVLGYDDETFGPDDTITREQLATILYRYEKMNGGGFTGLWMFRLDYADAANVSDWAYEAMCWMTMNKIVQGKNGNVLDPQGGATRAEAATMLYRYCTKD